VYGIHPYLVISLMSFHMMQYGLGDCASSLAGMTTTVDCLHGALTLNGYRTLQTLQVNDIVVLISLQECGTSKLMSCDNFGGQSLAAVSATTCTGWLWRQSIRPQQRFPASWMAGRTRSWIVPHV
jgi:hypothetical protein